MGKLVPALVALVIAAAMMACVHLGIIASPAFDNLPPLGDVAAARVRGIAHLAAEIVVLGPAGPLYARIAAAARAGFLAARAEAAKRGATPIASFDGIRVAATAFASGARGAISASTLAVLAAIAYTVINTRRASALRARRAAANAATRAVRQPGVRRLCGLASNAKRPSWASDEAKAEGDVERVEWFNTFLDTLWPYIAQATRATVRRVIEPKLDSQRPKGISSMTFDAFNLGTIPPLIEHIALVPPDEADELQIQVKFTWKGNPKVVFKVQGPMIYGGTSPLKIDVGELAISATAKITLAHLMGEAPCVGGTQITLTEDPYVSYRIAVKAAPGMPSVSLGSIPGLGSAVRDAITVAFREKMVFPKSINKVITKKHTPWTVRAIEDAIAISPVGRLRCTVRGASGLKNMEMMGTSDPYAVVALGSRKTAPLISDCQRTKTIDNTLHPTWEETFELDVCSTELQCLWVRVYDDDGQYGTDDLMGSVVLPLSGLPADGGVVRGSYPLRKEKELQTGGTRGKKSGKGRGDLFLELTYVPITEPADETRKRLDRATREAEAKYRENAPGWYGFQAEICRLLGIKGRRDGKALSALLESDKGTLDHLTDGRLRHLVSTLPPRMDLGHGIPLWAAFPGFEGMRSMNSILLTVWPYAATAVRRDVETLNAEVLPKKLPPFMRARVIADLGAIPPTFESVRAFKSDGDEICLEFHLKIAGDMRFGVAFNPLFFAPLCGARVQLAEVTLLAIVRVKLQPLVPRIPIVAGTAVSFVGDMLADAAVRLELPLMPGLDLGCLPGVDLAKKMVLGGVVPGMFRYPSWLYSPVLDFDHPAVKQLTRGGGGGSDGDGEHVVTVKVKRARNLDATDGWYSDPFAIVVVAGEADYASRAKRTDVKKRTLKPAWDQTFSFSAADADVLMVAVFDSDAKPTVAKAIDPARLRRKMAPVMRHHAKSLPHAERFHMRVDDIPFHGTVAAKAKAAAEARAIEDGTMSKTEVRKLEKKAQKKANKKANSVGKLLSEAKKRDIERRAALEPPLPPRILSPQQIEKAKKKAAKDAKKAEKARKKAEKDAKKAQKAASKRSLNKSDSMEEEQLDPDRVVSDVEQCIINETVTLSNDLLGMCHVDFKRLLRPGQRKTVWLRLEGGPSDQKRADVGEIDLEDPDGIDPNEEVYGSNADAAGERVDSGFPEIELEIGWMVYEDVSFGTKAAAAVDDDDDDDSYPGDEKIGTVAGTSNDSGIATGSLHVEVVRCADLQKPKVGTLYKAKMSGERVTPKVDVYVGNQHASTQSSRGVDPTFKEHFDFPGVTSLDELVVRVAHPGRKSMSTKMGLAKVRDKFMGSVVVPLNGVVKSGAIAGTYALGGVKHGEVTLALSYRVERKY